MQNGKFETRFFLRKAAKMKCLQHFFDTKSRRRKGTKFFVSRKARKGAKTQRHEGIETHEDAKSRKILFRVFVLRNGL